MTKEEAIEAVRTGHQVKTPRCPGAVLLLLNGTICIRYHEGTTVHWIQQPNDETPDWELCT